MERFEFGIHTVLITRELMDMHILKTLNVNRSHRIPGVLKEIVTLSLLIREPKIPKQTVKLLMLFVY